MLKVAITLNLTWNLWSSVLTTSLPNIPSITFRIRVRVRVISCLCQILSLSNLVSIKSCLCQILCMIQKLVFYKIIFFFFYIYFLLHIICILIKKPRWLSNPNPNPDLLPLASIRMQPLTITLTLTLIIFNDVHDVYHILHTKCALKLIINLCNKRNPTPFLIRL